MSIFSESSLRGPGFFRMYFTRVEFDLYCPRFINNDIDKGIIFEGCILVKTEEKYTSLAIVFIGFGFGISLFKKNRYV